MSVVLKSVEALLGPKLEGCESASLRLEKFASPEADRKQTEVESIVKCANDPKARFPSCSPVETFPLPKDAVLFHAKLEGRLLVNHAGGALENTGLCIHRFFGIPCIPGSALKGVARHAAWCAWDAESDPTKKDELAREIAQLFGCPTNEEWLDKRLEELGFDRQSGCVSFLPAYPSPSEKFSFVSDLVNCHHKDYYGGGKARATDDESPVPNKFPAVESGPFFQFAIVPGVRATEQDVARARHWLIEAVINQGVGAKTAAGYGWFSYRDSTGIKVDNNLVAEFQKLSQTQLLKRIKEVDKDCTDDNIQRALFEVARYDLWEKNKNNKGGPVYRILTKWARNYGEELP